MITSKNEDIIKVEDGKLVPVGVGTATVSVSAEGNATYNAADPKEVVVEVNKGLQTIAVSAPKVTTSDAPAKISAIARSGLQVAFSVATPRVCELKNGLVVAKDNGKCTIVASQSGSVLWEPANSVSVTIDATVGQGSGPVPANAISAVISASVVPGASGGIKLSDFEAFRDADIALGALSKGLSDAKLVNGELKVSPTPGFSGITYVVVTVIREGATASIPISVTVNPEPVAKVTVRPTSATSTAIDWQPSPNATGYVVFVNGVKVCESSATSCQISKLLGPNDRITVKAIGNDDTSSNTIESQLTVSKPIPLPTIVSTSSKLTKATTASVAKVASVVKETGFRTVTLTVPVGKKETVKSVLAKAKVVAAAFKARSGVDPVIKTVRATTAQQQAATKAKTVPSSYMAVTVN